MAGSYRYPRSIKQDAAEELHDFYRIQLEIIDYHQHFTESFIKKDEAMPVLFFFGAWFCVELLVMIAVGKSIGFLGVLALLILASMAGSAVLRGQRQFFTFQMRTMQGRPQAMQEGMYRLLAGMLLIIPGFVSDILAIILLLPGLRGLLGIMLLRAFKPEMMMGRFGYGQDVPRNVYEHDGTVEAKREDGTVIEGEFIQHQERRR